MFLFSVAMAQEAETRYISGVCDLQIIISNILPIIGFVLFVIAGVVVWPALGLTILGFLLKKDKTEEQDPGAYKLYKYGVLGLKILAGVIGLAILTLILYFITPVILSALTGVSTDLCQSF